MSQKPWKWTEHEMSRQATKLDLLDIAGALGLAVNDSFSVPQIRACLRLRIDRMRVTADAATDAEGKKER